MQSFIPSFDASQQAWRRDAWLAFLVVATVGMSLLFTCAMPFAALATAVAMTSNRKQTIGFMLAACVLNQLVGLAFRGYPHEISTLLWAGVFAACTVASAVAASAVVEATRARFSPFMVMAATLAAAFVAFQFVLLLANLTPLGTLASFALATKAKIALINIAAMGAICLANRIVVAIGFLSAPQRPAAVMA
ncbi:MAG: hypothetical protein SFX19_02750 [Alphaproteobacteria bacterium]|nr:hypothetical protein [Alphaproteobacteria bacterium]